MVSKNVKRMMVFGANRERLGFTKNETLPIYEKKELLITAALIINL